MHHAVYNRLSRSSPCREDKYLWISYAKAMVKPFVYKLLIITITQGKRPFFPVIHYFFFGFQYAAQGAFPNKIQPIRNSLLIVIRPLKLISRSGATAQK